MATGGYICGCGRPSNLVITVTPLFRGPSLQGTLSYGVIYHLTCKCPSDENDEGHLVCRDTFALALRCPLIRGLTV